MSNRPFTWVVAFTVHPLWVADGFSFSDERARNMLSADLCGAHNDEISATVLHAPGCLRIAREQGYGPKHPFAGKAVRELLDGTPAAQPGTSVLYNSLVKARDLIDSVAFVREEGDKDEVLKLLHDAIDLLVGPQTQAALAARNR